MTIVKILSIMMNSTLILCLKNEGGEEASDPHQSVFKTLRNKFQQVDMVDDVVNEDLADFVNTSFKNGLTNEKKNELLKDIHRPANTEALVRT